MTPNCCTVFITSRISSSVQLTGVQPLMDSQFLAEEESLVADRALEWFFAAVCETVLAQTALINKRAAAHVAGVWTLTSTQQHSHHSVVANLSTQ